MVRGKVKVITTICARLLIEMRVKRITHYSGAMFLAEVIMTIVAVFLNMIDDIVQNQKLLPHYCKGNTLTTEG